MAGPTTDETLETLHDEMCKSLSSERLLDYLMDSVPYLKTRDLSGWKARFIPTDHPPQPPAKRLRMSPNAVIHVPLPACTECGATDVIDDTRNGTTVCTVCGLIQSQGVCTGDIAHCSFDRMRSMTRVYTHHYSRVVHFRAVVSQLTGQSRPVISDDTLSDLRANLGGGPVNTDNVIKAIRILGLNRKYRRHAMSISCILGGEEKDDEEIPADIYYAMLKMFIRVEYQFNHKRNVVCPNRKVFFSYKFLLYQFLHQLGAGRWAKIDYLLKGPVLLAKQQEMYRLICEPIGYKVFM